MSLLERVWNTLKIEERSRLLKVAHCGAMSSLNEFESKRQWDDLLPSTQKCLGRVDWSETLGRELAP